MPLKRYLIRNEYWLGDDDLYRDANKDDPEALLEGVSMSGLVGLLRQLGDLAQFAAEMFHDLHEEVMATAARGHDLVARVQQLETEFPSMEKTLLSQTSHTPFLYNSGMDWHPSIRMDDNLVSQSDMPRFVMDSYEECRGPPRLYLLDKFDVAGAGACLKRYTDPSSLKADLTDYNIEEPRGHREKKIQKVKDLKRRGPWWRNGDTPEAFPSSHAKLHQLLLEERLESGETDPKRRVKLKRRALDGFRRDESLKSYMQNFFDTCSPECKDVREISLDLVPLDFETNVNTAQSGLEMVEIVTVSPTREPSYSDEIAYSSLNVPDMAVKSPTNEINSFTSGGTVEIPRENYENDMHKLLPWLSKEASEATEDLAADDGNKSECSAVGYNTDDTASELENFVDALATMDSDIETDSEYRIKGNASYLNGGRNMIDSDSSEGKQDLQNMLLDYHSVMSSTTSHNGSLLKEINSFPCSDNSNNIADSKPDCAAEGSKSSAVNILADVEKSVTVEAQQNRVEEYVASGVAENIGNSFLVEAELNDPTWSSVKVYTEMVRMDEKSMTRTNEDSKDQAVLHTLPSSGYGHPMPIGERPVHEMADAGSDTFADVSLEHSHVPDYTSSQIQLYSVKADESNETVNSFSVTSAGNPIDDLRKQVEEVSSDGLLVFQKSSPSVLYHPKPVLSDFENDTTSANEANSEDQLDRLSLVQDPEQPEGHMNGTSTPVDDHSDRQSPAVENHYPPEDMHVGKTDSTETLEFDSSEFEVASTIDECREMTAPGSTEATGKTTTNMDGSIKMNLLVVSSKIFSDPNESLKMTDDHIFSDGQMAGADSHFTISSAEGLYTASPLYEVDPDFHADGVENHNDSVAMDPDQLDLEPLRSSNTCLVDDVSGSLEAEGAASYKDGITDNNNRAPYPAATSNDSPSKHFPEGNSYLDLFHSATGLQHAGTKVAGAGNVYLKVENTLAQRQSLSSVPNCSLMEYSDKQNEESLSVCEDAYENSKQSQISLQHRGEVDLQSPAIPRIDDFVNSDSSICHTSKGNCVLRMADAVHGTCLAEEALLPCVECDQHLERSNFVQHQVVEDLEHDLDALANANTKLRTAFSKAAETQDFDNTKNSLKSMEGASQSLEYAQGNVPLKDCGNEMCINPISVSCLFVEGEPATPSDLVSTHRQPLLVEIPEQSADDEEKRTGLVMEQSHEDLSSTILIPDEAKASMIVENAGQTVDLPQLGIPRFSTLSDPTHIKPQEMPPLPPIKWRLGRSPNTSVASKGIMQHALGTVRSDHAGLRSQKSVGAEHLNQFLSLSAKNVSFPHVVGFSGGNMEQPIGSTLSVPSMVHEGGQELSINADRRQDVQLCMVDEEDFPTSDRRMDDFSLKPLESGYATALLEQVFQKKTTTAVVDQVEHVSSSAEQQTAVEDEQCKHVTEQEFGSASAQFEPSFTMQYGHPLPQGFMDREAQGLWSADIYGTIKLENVNHTLQKKIPRPRNPLIDEVVALDKTKLRKVGERVKSQDKQEAEKLQQNLPQLRKVGERVKLPDAVKAEESHHSFPPLRKVGERTKQQDAVKTEGSRNSFPQLRKVGECAKRQDAVKTEGSHSSFPPLRKVGERVETRDERTTAGIAQHRPQLRKVVGKFESQNEPTEENTQYFLQLRKVAERVEDQDGQTTEVNTLYLPQLRKVGEKIKPEDESNAEESKQSFLPLRDDSGRLKSEDGAQAEDRDSLLLQIRNKTFNLKPAVTSRPSVQGPQTNLKVAAILERASTIRQAMAGSDEEDSDGWGDN